MHEMKSCGKVCAPVVCAEYWHNGVSDVNLFSCFAVIIYYSLICEKLAFCGRHMLVICGTRFSNLTVLCGTTCAQLIESWSAEDSLCFTIHQFEQCEKVMKVRN